MPISKHNLARYPKNWKETSLRIRARAGNRCEGAPGIYPDCRAENGKPHPVTGSRVILTVAHLNHDPRDCADANLKALCQRCHLTYDAKHHAKNAQATMRARKAAGDLFDMSMKSQNVDISR